MECINLESHAGNLAIVNSSGNMFFSNLDYVVIGNTINPDDNQECLQIICFSSGKLVFDSKYYFKNHKSFVKENRGFDYLIKLI